MSLIDLATTVATGGFVPDVSDLSDIGASLFSGASDVTQAVSGIVGQLQAWEEALAGKTPHLDHGQGVTVATTIVGPPGGLWPLFQKAYTYDQLQLIGSFVPALFKSAMNTMWGFQNIATQVNNTNILFDVMTHLTDNNVVNRQLVNFIEWISWNIDSDRLVDEYAHVLPWGFDFIFIPAIQQAGLNPLALSPNLQAVLASTATKAANVAQPALTGQSPAAPVTSVGTKTSTSTIIIILAVLAVGAMFIFGKK
jgi:hypothetical protein